MADAGSQSSSSSSSLACILAAPASTVCDFHLPSNPAVSFLSLCTAAGGLSTGSSGALGAGAGAGKKRKAAAAPSPLSPGFQDNDEDDPDFVMGGG